MYLKFSINDRVFINELGLGGLITAIWITDTGTKYHVRYFRDFVAEEVYFLECELALENKNKTTGYYLDGRNKNDK